MYTYFHEAMTKAVKQIGRIDRRECRKWVEESASHDGFAKRVESWIKEGIKANDSSSG